MARQTPAAAAAPDDDAPDVIEQVPPPAEGSDIYERLAWAQAQVSPVDKRGRNNDQKYDYAKAEDVYAMLRPILARAGIAYVVAMNGLPRLEPTGQETSRGLSYMRWWIDVLILLRSSEVPGSPVTVDSTEGGDPVVVDGGKANEMRIIWTCVADDYSDKGAAKAMTLGLKSWLMATFMVSSGSDDAESTDRQAGPAQRAGTTTPASQRGGPGDEQPRLSPLVASQRQAFAAARKVEGDHGPAKAIEITRYITGFDKIKDVPDAAILKRLVGAFDHYRNNAEQRDALDARMAAHLAAVQDVDAEGPTRQEPRADEHGVDQHGIDDAPLPDPRTNDPGPHPMTPPPATPDAVPAGEDFDPATEPVPPPVVPPGEQTSLGDPA